jgi:hypothetical protein
MRLTLLTSFLVAVSGCATVAATPARAPDDDARLAALPQVPLAPEVPRFPPALRGLTFHVTPLVEGAALDDGARMEVARACAANFAQWMGAAGWIAVDDRAPAELAVEEHCTAGLTMRWNGALLELRHPPSQTLAIVVRHDGAPIVTVPRGPDDYVCASSALDVRRDCLARAEAWAQAHILDTLFASPPLAALAQQLRGAQ